jgi:glycosyltransferase involved in cell wall biosynthesis
VRILILHSRYLSGPASGENRVAEDEAALLRAGGHEVATWAPEPEVGGPRELLATAASTVWSRHAAAAVHAEVRRRGAEVVHVHNLFPTLSPAVLRAADEAGAAVVVTLHNYRLMCLPATFLREGRVCEDCLGHGTWRGVRHRCYRDSLAASATLAASLGVHRRLGTFEHVTTFLAVSGFVRSKYLEAGFAPDRVTVKPNFSHDTDPRTGPGEYFLYLGRLAQEKGVDTLMRAWRTAPGRLVVVGDGPQAGELRRLAPSAVEFVGQVDADRVAPFLSKARALVVPSRWYEAAPRGITEAYAAGVPVLATRIGALEEAVEDGVTGVLVAPEDPDAWAGAAERLADDATSLRLGAAARELWARRFSPEHALEDLESAYADAVRRRTG